jgi:hypothetical protein
VKNRSTIRLAGHPAGLTGRSLVNCLQPFAPPPARLLLDFRRRPRLSSQVEIVYEEEIRAIRRLRTTSTSQIHSTAPKSQASWKDPRNPGNAERRYWCVPSRPHGGNPDRPGPGERRRATAAAFNDVHHDVIVTLERPGADSRSREDCQEIRKKHRLSY